MKIKIKNNASHIYTAGVRNHELINWKWVDTLRKINGTTIEVDTKFLFKDQFNTFPIPGVTNNGLRIMENCVDEVIDDARIGQYQCNYCNGHSYHDDICPHCGNTGTENFEKLWRDEK